jgi:hypothetical protein
LLPNTQFSFTSVNFNGASHNAAYFPGHQKMDGVRRRKLCALIKEQRHVLSNILDGIHPVLYRAILGCRPIADSLVPANAGTGAGCAVDAS